MDILDSFGDLVQLIITVLAVVIGIKILVATSGFKSYAIFGLPIVAVWIFFDYDIYLGMIIGSIILLFLDNGEDNSDVKLGAIILLILTLLKFGYFGFIKWYFYVSSVFCLNLPKKSSNFLGYLTPLEMELKLKGIFNKVA